MISLIIFEIISNQIAHVSEQETEDELIIIIIIILYYFYPPPTRNAEERGTRMERKLTTTYQ